MITLKSPANRGMRNPPRLAASMMRHLITELSREKDLFVIARNSSSIYKGKIPNIKQVAKDLGVRYVLEGSIRRSGNKIRLNAQLIDGKK